MNKKPIFVTQPYLPPLEEFIPYLEQIWKNKQLTNGGPMHQQLEQELADYLGVPAVALFNNGTNALLTALQSLELTGEVITTPYSFVATSHSLLWNGLTPVFVDIDRKTLNIDPEKIQEAITPKTSAIMPVHCYGNPCKVEEIKRIADYNKLKIIYDAAHAFGVNDTGGSILRHGNLSVLSFHATKVFNTFEGGAIVCPDFETKQHIERLRNFGIVDETSVIAAGINGKMSEVNAAFGLLQMRYISTIIEGRRTVDTFYREHLSKVTGITVPQGPEGMVGNYSYFPILVEEDYQLTRDELYNRLKEQNVYARRYFYPLISDFPMYQALESSTESNLKVATSVAKKILCLPIFPQLDIDELKRIVGLIKEA